MVIGKVPADSSVKKTSFPVHEAQSTTSIRRVLVITELLSVIFMHCVMENENQSHSADVWPWSLRLSEGPSRWYPRLSGKEAPLLLTHVCRGWRRTAIDTPQLWTYLHLDISDDIGDDSPLPINQLSALKYWMKLSRDFPLSVCFTIGWRNLYGNCDRGDFFGSYGTRFESPFILEIVEELFRHTHRWENIFIYLPEFCLLPFYSSVHRNFPCLKTIELVPTYLADVSGDVARDLSLRSAPELRALALIGPTMDDYVVVPGGLPPRLQSLELNSVDIRFGQRLDGCQLREIVLKDTTVCATDLAKFPIAFPLLEELTVITSFERMPARGGDESIVLERLIKLRLSSYSEDSFPLRFMTAPVLKHMVVKELFEESWVQQNQSFEDDILHFLRRSKAPVELFSYTSAVQTGNDFGTILREMPGLATLKVEGSFLPPEAIKSLIDPMVCPRLVSMYMKGPYSEDANLRLPSVSDITQLIERRCRKIGSESSGEEVEIGGRDREFLQQVSLPVCRDIDVKLRMSRIFQGADVDWMNTYDYDDLYEVSD